MSKSACHRRFDGSDLVIASHNPGKIREIAELLQPFEVAVSSAADRGYEEPEETGSTFRANAELKALASARASGLPSLADDSGLAVTALGGDPGIYSARWAGPEKDFNLAMEKVHRELGEVPDRSAWFICALCLAWPEGHTEIFQGDISGRILWPMRGSQGFGYDPIFLPDGYDLTFGEMDPAQKHAMSHRAHAFSQLVEACFSP